MLRKIRTHHAEQLVGVAVISSERQLLHVADESWSNMDGFSLRFDLIYACFLSSDIDKLSKVI